MPQVRSVPDLTNILHDTAVYVSMFDQLNRSLDTLINKLSKRTERGERSLEMTLKKPKSYKDESGGCIDT